MSDIVSDIIVIAVALVFSAFFSGMEIAYLSSNKLRLEIDKKQSKLFDRIAGFFSRMPGDYISTIIIGNNIALVIYSITMSSLIMKLAVRWFDFTGNTLVYETVISTIIIIFTGEFLPKSIFKSNPNFYYRTFAPVVYLLWFVFWPISKFTTLLSRGIMSLMGFNVKREHEGSQFDKTDLTDLVEDISGDAGEASEAEMKMFQKALDFSDTSVRDCMLRRIEIEAVDIDDTVNDVKKKFIETKYSRLPVFSGSIDHIIGYVNIKDLLGSPSSVKQMLRPVTYVPETMTAQKLLGILTKNRRAMAIVLDEYGGTAGMVTLEDILEEIFGEIEDEHDNRHLVEKVTAAGDWILSGRLEVDYINEKYGLGIPVSDEYDTLAGYVIYHNEGIPKPHEEIVIDSFRFRMLKMSANKIELVKVTLVDPK